MIGHIYMCEKIEKQSKKKTGTLNIFDTILQCFFNEVDEKEHGCWLTALHLDFKQGT